MDNWFDSGLSRISRVTPSLDVPERGPGGEFSTRKKHTHPRKIRTNPRFKKIKPMPQKLVITLDEETTQRYLDFAGKKTKAEADADCEPSGTAISIHIAPEPYDSMVFIEQKELGEAKVELVEV